MNGIVIDRLEGKAEKGSQNFVLIQTEGIIDNYNFSNKNWLYEAGHHVYYLSQAEPGGLALKDELGVEQRYPLGTYIPEENTFYIHLGKHEKVKPNEY
ncbi:MAG: hypothetical protein ABUK01_01080 [Leptospirales bacterium]